MTEQKRDIVSCTITTTAAANSITTAATRTTIAAATTHLPLPLFAINSSSTVLLH